MSHAGPVRLISRSELVAGSSTPGLSRAEAISTDTLWGGMMTMEAGAVSGWHHHAEFETLVFVLRGALRVDYGANGSESVVAGAGEFLYIPGDTVHREAAAGAGEVAVVAVRAGSGVPVVNVDYPPVE